MVRVPVRRIGDGQHLHEERFVPRLAVLARQVIAELLGALQQQVLEAKDDGAAVGERLASPLGLRGPRLLHGPLDILRGGDPHLAEQATASGLVHGERALRTDASLRGPVRDRDRLCHGSLRARWRTPVAARCQSIRPPRNSDLTWVVYTAMLAQRRMLELDDMLRLGSQPLDT